MSANHKNSFEHSLVIGEKTFSGLIEDTVPVWPQMYEVLYAYETGENGALIEAINKLKKVNDGLNADDLQKIHEDHFCNADMLNVSEDIGTRISDEILKIIAAMDTAGQRSDECDAALTKIKTKFPSVKTPEQLHGVVEILSGITKAIADNNKSLTSKLQQSSQQIDVLHKDLEQARNESNTDALTGLANRKKFDSGLRSALDALEEDKAPLTLLLVDIDFFKKFNDTYGHQTGDQILRLVAHTLRKGLKGRDLPTRYGGEEFAIILPGTTSDNALIVADQIRETIAAKELIKRSTGENLGHVTISIGIAQACEGDSPSRLIERSDKALYEAKDTGRNRCVIAPAAS
ncbi:MAG: diguanylate cyclase [Hyphomicrobiaceae bacterium]|nr:diguanylate cyclase [Hyphomicrobiaceae bacterium]